MLTLAAPLEILLFVLLGHLTTDTDADLEGVNFHQKSEFQGAKFNRVNVKGAHLTKADFTGADLTGTDFSVADNQYVIFRDVKGVSDEDLSKLQQRAARWEYDWQVFLEKLLNVVHVLGFCLVPVLAILLGVNIRRTVNRPGKEDLVRSRFG